MRNAVKFKSAKFNTTDVKDYFINDICFGDDLAKFLTENTKARELKTVEPWQEDWGWQFETEDCLISIAFDGDEWRIYIEPISSFFQKLTGRIVSVSNAAANLHRILINEPRIFEIQWFQFDENGREFDFAAEP